MNPTTDVPTTYEPEDVVGYHGKLAADWEKRYQKRSFQARLEVLEECVRGRNLTQTEWLDAGCGTGTLTRFLAEKGGFVTGLDAAPGMIEIAREQGKRHPRGAQMRFDVVRATGAGTIEALPNATASLDGILCSSVLEYMPNVEQCLADFARVVKAGGLLLVSVPNAESVVRRVQLSVHRWGRRLGQRWLDFIEYSRNEYSAREFERLLQAHGFEVERVIVFGSPMPRWMQRQRRGGSLLMFVAVRR
jgi:2-polyprenyl-6-hydroxyphenyl methylase/3-demethylubiquinone-9 3-methyltransferase